MDLSGARIAILATHGFEESELLDPRRALDEAGAITEVVSPEAGPICAWSGEDWGEEVAVDVPLAHAKADDYEALLLPGGVMNPDHLRRDPQAVAFVRAFAEAGKPIAAICHGPWLLVEADLLRGRRATSFASIATDLRNAGADWVDEAAVVDGRILTSRSPADLPDFDRVLVELVAASRHAGAGIGGGGELRADRGR